MKKCSRCAVLKSEIDFGIRIEKRRPVPYSYLNSTCRKCDSEMQMERYHKKKNDPEFIQKNRNRAKEYRLKNLDHIAAKLKQKRQTPKYNQYVKEYYKKNWGKIRNQASRTNFKYIEKQRQLITDKYAIIQLTHPRYGITKSEVTPEMIEAKKISIAIHRLTKSIKKLNNAT